MVNDLMGIVTLDDQRSFQGRGLRFEDRYCVVADARLDDRDRLLADLRQAGIPVSAKAPVEQILLAAYLAWADECPERLVGDFAFAIWDRVSSKLFCVRDSAGVRPFHYCYEPGRFFAFASRALDLLELPGVSRDLDGFALVDFLMADVGRHSRTMFAAIHRLPPGWSLSLESGVPTTRRWFEPKTVPVTSDGDWAQAFLECFQNAVQDRVHGSDAPPAVLLSGGLDSSSVAVVARELAPTPPVAVSELFDSFDRCDERFYSRQVARHAGLETEEVQAEEHLEVLGSDSTEPVDHPTLLAGSLTDAVFERLHRHHCATLLTGIGGDGLFDGARLQADDYMRSGRFRELWPWLQADRQQGKPWAKVLLSRVVRPWLPTWTQRVGDRVAGRGRFRHPPSWLHSRLDRPMLHRRLTAPRILASDALEGARRLQYQDLVGLAQQGIVIDFWSWHGRHRGIESTHPFLDRRLVDLTWTAPLEVQARPGPRGTKALLRDALEERLPEGVRNRTTKGTWGPWLEHVYRLEARERIRSLFTDGRLASLELVDSGKLLEGFDSFCDRGGTAAEVSAWVFPIYLERWLRLSASESAKVRFVELSSWQTEDGIET